LQRVGEKIRLVAPDGDGPHDGGIVARYAGQRARPPAVHRERGERLFVDADGTARIGNKEVLARGAGGGIVVTAQDEAVERAVLGLAETRNQVFAIGGRGIGNEVEEADAARAGQAEAVRLGAAAGVAEAEGAPSAVVEVANGALVAVVRQNAIANDSLAAGTVKAGGMKLVAASTSVVKVKPTPVSPVRVAVNPVPPAPNGMHDRAKVSAWSLLPQVRLPVICVHFGATLCICVHFGAFAIITYHLRSLQFTADLPGLFKILIEVIFAQVTF